MSLQLKTFKNSIQSDHSDIDMRSNSPVYLLEIIAYQGYRKNPTEIKGYQNLETFFEKQT